MPTREGGDRSLGALLNAYLDELRARGVSLFLEQRARLVLPRLFAHLRDQGVREVRAVSEAHLIAFARHLAAVPKKRGPEGAKLSPGTQGCYLDSVRGFFAFLEKRGVILINPALELPTPKALRLPRRVLSEAEARRLMNAPSRVSVLGHRDQAILETLYGTGIRRSECLRLDVTDLDLGQELLFVRNGKGKKDRLVPLTGQARAALDGYLRDGRPELVNDSREVALFLSKYGHRLGPTQLYALLRTHARAAGIKGPIFPHVMRHSYATHLLKGKASIRHVQELLGHQSLQATALYTRVDVEDLREVLRRCHPRERPRQRQRRR